MQLRRFGIVLLLLLAVVSHSAWRAEAWGGLGHRAVGQVAYDRLTSQARSAVNRYLNGETLATAAVYPDTYRSQGGSWSSPLHFVNFPRNAVSYKPAYCGQPPMCVVSAIANYTRLLSSEGLRGPLCQYGKGDSPCPLSFLSHFVGDIHQPLHCGYADDKGGNSVQVVTFWGKSTNLHSLWDSVMLERYEPNFNTLVELLHDHIDAQPGKVKQWLSAMDPAQWADESYHIVEKDVYRFQGGNVITITEEYYADNVRIIVDQLAAAGVRLAASINAAYP